MEKKCLLFFIFFAFTVSKTFLISKDFNNRIGFFSYRRSPDYSRRNGVFWRREFYSGFANNCSWRSVVFYRLELTRTGLKSHKIFGVGSSKKKSLLLDFEVKKETYVQEK